MAKGSGGTRTSRPSRSKSNAPKYPLPFGEDKQANLRMIIDDFWKNYKSEENVVHLGKGRKNITLNTYTYSLGGYDAKITYRDNSEIGHLVITDPIGKTRVDRSNSGVLTNTGMLPRELYSLIKDGKSLREKMSR